MSSVAKDQDSERPPEGAITGNRRKADPLIGTTVNGRFKILSVIARGGMGKVYQAEQAPLGRICALKVLNPKYDGDEDPEFQRRFYLEASTAAKLTHPNTVTIFDYGRDEPRDIYYIAMEYVRGRTLFRVLRDEGTVAEDRVAHIIRQVGRSLREAHTLGVIHRDMKPANVVLVEGSDEIDGVKVLDFGLVKDVTGDDPEDLTQQGLFMGSPKYMAPEQILGNAVSPATDIYSLGIVAYELITGNVPFDKGSSVKTLMAHVNEAPQPMRVMNPRVYLSGEMNAIVMKCLEKDPLDRYPTMDALLRALTNVEGGGTLTESLLAGPVVNPAQMGGSDVYALLDGPDAMESSPTRTMSRSSRPAPPASSPPFQIRGGLQSDYPSQDDLPPSLAAPPASHRPSGTPQPMEQLALDDLAMPKRSSTPIKLTIGVVLLVGLVAGGFALREPSTEGAAESADVIPPTKTVETTTAGASTVAPVVRTVRVTSKPSGAKVELGDEVLCGATPCDVTWRGDDAARVHELVLSLDGHAPARVAVPVDVKAIAGSLARKKPIAARPTPRPAAPAPPPPPPPAQPPAKPKLSGYKDSPY